MQDSSIILPQAQQPTTQPVLGISSIKTNHSTSKTKYKLLPRAAMDRVRSDHRHITARTVTMLENNIWTSFDAAITVPLTVLTWLVHTLHPSMTVKLQWQM